MSRPLVSAIIPTYNCAGYVGAAIRSVLDQGYAPMEVVVVDDGSTDGTVDVLRGFGERIRLIVQPNRGPAAARNAAVRAARGEYLAFLDGDDLWLPGQPRVLVEHLLAHPHIKVGYAEWLVWNADPDGHHPPLSLPSLEADPAVDAMQSGWIYSRLLLDALIPMITAVIHRSVHDAVGGFDESLRSGSDYDFWLRVSRKFEVVKLRRPVAVYRQNPASVTHVVRPENNGYRLLKRALDLYGLADDAGNVADRRAVEHRLAELAVIHGYRHYWHGDPKVAAASLALALRHNPLRWRAAVYWVAATARLWGLWPSHRRAADSDRGPS
jgi:glycosyltransferase involved in cell wall biosynthesis